MYTILLVVHVILVLAMIGTVLLQRSEGGALGMGGGGGGLMSGRSQANLLTRATSVLAGLFMLTSIALTLIASNRTSPKSIIEQIQTTPAEEAPAEPEGPNVPIAE